jgi:hypothetical protein
MANATHGFISMTYLPAWNELAITGGSPVAVVSMDETGPIECAHAALM